MSQRVRWGTAFIVAIVLAHSPIWAQVRSGVKQVAPTTGAWKGWEPGTFIITRSIQSTARPSTTPARGTRARQPAYTREVLIGTDAKGESWTAVSRSDSPSGPWTAVFGSGGSTQVWDPPARVTQLGRKALLVAGRSIECDVISFEALDDSSRTVGERWTDPLTGLDLRVSWTIRPRDADAPPSQRSYEQAAIGFESRTVDGKAIEGVVLESTPPGTANPATATRSRWVLSDKVPGQQLYFATFSAADPSNPASGKELISFGKDAAALAAGKSQTPSEPADSSPSAFCVQALAEAASTDPAIRQHGLATLGMNKFAAKFKAQIEQAIRAGLEDADSNVSRAAAIAAGWNKLAGVAPRIIQLAQADASNEAEYVRALGYLADPAGLPFILSYSEKAPRGQNETALLALASFTDDRALAVLKDQLARPESTRRSNILRILGRGADPRHIDLLITAAADPARWVRSCALISLAERRDPKGLSTAIAGLNDSDSNTRLHALHAVEVLAADEPQRARDAVYPLLKAADAESFRYVAIAALARLKDERMLPELRQMAADRNKTIELAGMPLPVAMLGVTGLVNLGTADALEALLDLAKDSTRSDDVYRALTREKNPAIARLAWPRYVQIIKAPTSAPATRSAVRSVDPSSQLLTIVQSLADRQLQAEIDASIESSPVRRRPELRRTVRMIGERLSTEEAQPKD